MAPERIFCGHVALAAMQAVLQSTCEVTMPSGWGYWDTNCETEPMKWWQLGEGGCMVRRSATEQCSSSGRRAAHVSRNMPVCSIKAQLWNRGQEKEEGAGRDTSRACCGGCPFRGCTRTLSAAPGEGALNRSAAPSAAVGDGERERPLGGSGLLQFGGVDRGGGGVGGELGVRRWRGGVGGCACASTLYSLVWFNFSLKRNAGLGEAPRELWVRGGVREGGAGGCNELLPVALGCNKVLYVDTD